MPSLSPPLTGVSASLRKSFSPKHLPFPFLRRAKHPRHLHYGGPADCWRCYFDILHTVSVRGIVHSPTYRLSNRRVDRFFFSLLSAFMLFSARVHGRYMLFHPERRQDMD